MKLKDIKWYRLKQSIDITKILGRCYYFNKALIWWFIDIIVFLAIGIKWSLLLVSIPLGIITFLTTANWIRTLIYATLVKHSYSLFKDDLLDRSNAFQGVPRSGKSSSMNEFCYMLAKDQWKKLQHEYWKISPEKRTNSFDKTNLTDHEYETIKSYNYYNKHLDKFIPCLHSIIPIYHNGRQSYNLTKAQLLQEESLPYLAVQAGDEISNLFPNTNKGEEKKQNEKLAEMSRWIGQFTDSYAIFSDIRFSDAFLSIRSGCGCIITLTKKQKWILKPQLLISLRNLILSFVDFDYMIMDICEYGSSSYYKAQNSLLKSSKRTGKFICWLDKLIYSVGYRKYTYTKEGCKDLGNNDNVEVINKGRYYLKSCLNVQYNDRAFRNLYAGKYIDFKEPIVSKYDISEEELKNILGRK